MSEMSEMSEIEECPPGMTRCVSCEKCIAPDDMAYDDDGDYLEVCLVCWRAAYGLES